jgi:vitamin B12 transporter
VDGRDKPGHDDVDGSRLRTIGLSALTLALLASPSAGFAQIVLPQIDVVSATGIPTPIGQVANSVTVITREELERDQRRTVVDALSKVPGLNIVQSGGPGAVTSVFLRGTNSGHTKVIIDGIDISNPSNPNRVFDLSQLLTYDIERIEVLRGPQSGLYGSDAIGGVIFITTRKGEGPPKVTATVEGGSFGTFNQAASLSGSQDRFNYAFNVAHFISASTPVTPLELLPPGQKRNNDYFNNTTYSSRLGFDASDNVSFNWIGRYTDSKLRFTSDVFLPPDFFPAVPAANQSEQVAHQFFTRGEAVVTLLDGRFKNYFGAAYTDHWNHNFNPDNFPQTNVNKGERTKFDWRGVADVAPGQTLILGADQETERLRTDTTSAENGNKGAYAEWQSEVAKRFFLVANVRHDGNDSFGGHTTYRLAPAYIVPATETKLKASYGTGFKAPTLTQLFVDFPPTFFANPNLKPEQSKGYDLGFEQPLFNRARVGATYFHNDITDLINPAFVGGVFTNVNIGQAETDGVEAFAAVNVTEQLKLRADYTYTKAIDAITGQELLRRPRHKTSLTAAWTPTDALTLSATVLHVSSWQDIDRSTFATITQEGYTVVNVAGSYVINENVTAFARIDNLFNEHYENPNGFLHPSFGIYGGVRLANR